MKIADIRPSNKKKSFNAKKEKLKALWELISTVYKEKYELEYGCEKCDKGRIKKKNEGSFGYVTEMCECVSQVDEIYKAIEKLEDGWILPEHLVTYSLENFKSWMFSLDEMLTLLNRDDSWLYLYGDVGTGKTHAAFICLYAAVASGISIQYANVPLLLDKLRPQENRQEELMQNLIDTELLVLDDIGQEKVSSWVLERMYIIINERYVLGKKTIITSNSPIDGLLEKIWHKAIVSRIRGSSTLVHFIWNDKR